MSSLRPGLSKCGILTLNIFRFHKVPKSQKVKIFLSCFISFILWYFIFNKNGSVSSSDSDLSVISSPQTTSKILCYILLSQRLISAAKVIQETWGKECDRLVFFGRFQSSDVPIAFLNVSEGYAQLWGKTKAALIYLHEHAGEYDWFIKADSDTYVIIKNLRKFLSNQSSSIPSWFGYKLKHSQLKQGYMSGGAGYTFSKAALDKIVTLLSSPQDNNRENQHCLIRGVRGYEDLELGKCFNRAGVQEINTLDSEGKERFLPLPLNTLISGDLSNFHWIWQKAWNPPRIGPDCCSKELISMHQISPGGMRTLHFLLETIKLN